MRNSRKSAVALIVLGIAVCAGFFFVSEDFTPSMGLRWNLANMEVVLKDKIDETFMEVAEFRQRYPAYNDMDDAEISLRLRTKYFSDMSLEDYRRAFLTSEPEVPKAPGGDPLMLRREMEDLMVSDIFTRSVLLSDAIEYGLVTLTPRRAAFPYRYALLAGLGLVAIGAAGIALSGRKRI